MGNLLTWLDVTCGGPWSAEDVTAGGTTRAPTRGRSLSPGRATDPQRLRRPGPGPRELHDLPPGMTWPEARMDR
jgi:hypothetical protein